MRSEDEIRRELEDMEQVTDLGIGEGEVEFRVPSEDESRQIHEAIKAGTFITEPYQENKEQREAYLTGLNEGRQLALSWVLGDIDELY
jgi:hypothetical protein